MKKTILSAILALNLLSLSGTALADESGSQTIDVVIKNPHVDVAGATLKPKALEELAINYNGSLYVPLRHIAEALGRKIEWDGSTNTISITSPKLIQMPQAQLNSEVWSPKPTDLGERQISVDFTPLTFNFYGRIDNGNVQMEEGGKGAGGPKYVKPFIYKGTTYVSLRYVSEKLAQEVLWTNQPTSDLQDPEKSAFAVEGEAIWIGTQVGPYRRLVEENELTSARGQLVKRVQEFFDKEVEFSTNYFFNYEMNNMITPELAAKLHQKTKAQREEELDKMEEKNTGISGLEIADITYGKNQNNIATATVKGSFEKADSKRKLHTNDFLMTFIASPNGPIIDSLDVSPKK